SSSISSSTTTAATTSTLPSVTSSASSSISSAATSKTSTTATTPSATPPSYHHHLHNTPVTTPSPRLKQQPTTNPLSVSMPAISSCISSVSTPNLSGNTTPSSDRCTWAYPNPPSS